MDKDKKKKPTTKKDDKKKVTPKTEPKPKADTKPKEPEPEAVKELKKEPVIPLKPTNDHYKCPECPLDFETVAQLRSHLGSHVPERETYKDTILRMMEIHGPEIEKQKLMELCQEANPSPSAAGVKTWSGYISGLARMKASPIIVETIVRFK